MDWLEKWKPVYQAPDEGGAVETPVEGGEPPPSGPGSGRSELRQQLEKNFETDRKGAEKRDAPPKRGKEPRRVAGGAEIEPEAPIAEPAAGAEGAETVATPEGQQAATAAPEGFSAEAKA